MRWVLFLGVMFGTIAGNYLYQAFRFDPDWSAATERSWFQFVALASLAISWAIASINHQL